MAGSAPELLAESVKEGPPSTETGPPGSKKNGLTEVLIVAEDGEAGGIGRYCVDLAALPRDPGARGLPLPHGLRRPQLLAGRPVLGPPRPARPRADASSRLATWFRWPCPPLEFQPTTRHPCQRTTRQLRIACGSAVRARLPLRDHRPRSARSPQPTKRVLSRRRSGSLAGRERSDRRECGHSSPVDQGRQPGRPDGRHPQRSW